jgi:prlF antitoxin for toxin YhaV_toxin
MTFQEMVDSIEKLSTEDQEELFELIRKRLIEQRRSEILANARLAFKAVDEGTAKRGSFEDVKSYLLEEIKLPPIKRRTFPTALAGKVEILGDIVSPIVDEDDWEYLSHAENLNNDPLLRQFLNFLGRDTHQNPQHLQSISSDLVNRIQALVAGVDIDIDIDAPLADELEDEEEN